MRGNTFSFSGIIFTGLALTVLSPTAFAADRVIEDTLVYKDPTVAKKDQWVKGVSVDYWNVNTSIPSTYGNINVHFSQPGISAFVGYSDISVLASYRRGTGTADLNTTILGYAVAIHQSITDSQIEIDLRWLMHGLQTKFMTPYVLAAHVEQTTDITTSATLTSTGTNLPLTNPSDTSKTKTNGLGVGGIFPINAKFGVRADARYGRANSGSDNNSVALVTVTGYYNIAQGLNAQLGARYEQDGASSKGSAEVHITGLYATLGYSFR
jgi:hypothetical protein